MAVDLGLTNYLATGEVHPVTAGSVVAKTETGSIKAVRANGFEIQAYAGGQKPIIGDAKHIVKTLIDGGHGTKGIIGGLGIGGGHAQSTINLNGQVFVIDGQKGWVKGLGGTILGDRTGMNITFYDTSTHNRLWKILNH
jgi:hypothetical protein